MSTFEYMGGPECDGESHEHKMERWDEQDARRVARQDMGRFDEFPGVCDFCDRLEEPGENFGGHLLDPFPPICPECCDRQMMEANEAV